MSLHKHDKSLMSWDLWSLWNYVPRTQHETYSLISYLLVWICPGPHVCTSNQIMMWLYRKSLKSWFSEKLRVRFSQSLDSILIDIMDSPIEPEAALLPFKEPFRSWRPTVKFKIYVLNNPHQLVLHWVWRHFIENLDYSKTDNLDTSKNDKKNKPII